MFIFFLVSQTCLGQGLNSHWLIGDDPGNNTKGHFIFNDTSYVFNVETRKIPFRYTEGNISDEQGNLLMSSNGVWIANVTGDTMLNGSGLNPGPLSSNDGLMIPNANVFLPFPGDSNKYILLHHTGTPNGSYLPAQELLYSVIDKTLGGGLGEVISKNDTAFADTLGWGIGTCKHANGRDWWAVMLKDNSDVIFKILIDSTGIASISSQNLGLLPNPIGNVTQPIFSPDGKKFACSVTYGGANPYHDVRIFDFDRCNGSFSNGILFNISDSMIGLGLAFSSNSKLLYATSVLNVYQINLDSTQGSVSASLVAQCDTFFSPSPPFLTNFDLMYLAANGKIYIASSNSVLHMHYINHPDTLGDSCDVKQHDIYMGVFNFRTVPFHPNYYLGCDTTSGCPCLATTLSEIEKQNFNFSISPNPSNGNIKLMYILPQNKNGTFQIFDINGKAVYSQNLPQWSTLQNIDVSFLSPGVYSCQINSNNFLVSKKLVVIR
ncbi:MAG TPA: T9SS type A sorting domain-containing protein [Bacteroidia bacterium]|nr:T9SS type A sorting domain-containing protein [Bacteroidia bacterium]